MSVVMEMYLHLWLRPLKVFETTDRNKLIQYRTSHPFFATIQIVWEFRHCYFHPFLIVQRMTYVASFSFFSDCAWKTSIVEQFVHWKTEQKRILIFQKRRWVRKWQKIRALCSASGSGGFVNNGPPWSGSIKNIRILSKNHRNRKIFIHFNDLLPFWQFICSMAKNVQVGFGSVNS